MIQIRIADQELKEMLRRHERFFKTENHYYDTLKSYVHHAPAKEASFFRYLLENLNEILLGKPEDLQGHVDVISDRFDHLLQKKVIKDKLKNVFNYDSFSRRSPTASWGAYQLCRGLKITVCPYCNRQFISTYSSTDGKTRATLDHFYNQATHPYLAVSFYNLIPSCTVCNSNFKGDKTFSFTNHLNPYCGGFDDLLRFRTSFSKQADSSQERDYYQELVGKEEKFEIVLEENKNQLCHPNMSKARNNADVFHLENMYNLHKDQITELIQKSIVYSGSRIEELYSSFGGTLFSNKEEVLRMILSNYVVGDDQQKRVCAKFIRDIAEELGLLKLIES